MERIRAGTNTYILGRKPPYILLDTGDGNPEYIPVLERALRENDRVPPPNGVYISDVIISHKHPDHHGGLHNVLELLKQMWTRHLPSSSVETYTPPRLHKFASSSKIPDRWDTLLDASLGKIADGLVSIPPASCALSGTPELHRFHGIKEGQEFILTGDESTGGSIIRTIHTPGHTDDSICLYLQADQALFTFDSVLGHGTAVFENLSQYMASLQHLINLNLSDDRAGTTFTKLYPGHGPVVEDGEALIRQYIAHRLEREEELVRVLGSKDKVEDQDQSWTADHLLEEVYPPQVWEMARRGLLLHLHKLEVDGKVVKSQREGVDIWTLL